MNTPSSNPTLFSYQTPTEYWLLISLKKPYHLELILEQLPAPQEAFGLISRPEQLHDFVQTIPDLAWDIMEDSEKRLVVEFDSGKHQFAPLFTADGRLPLMLNKVEALQKPLQRSGGALWCLLMTEEAELSPDESLMGTKQLRSERRFWLGANSQIKVLQ